MLLDYQVFLTILLCCTTQSVETGIPNQRLGTRNLGHTGLNIVVTNESYTSKASFVDNDKMPKRYSPNAIHVFNGKRIKRGLYKSSNGIFLNADVNGAYNILRKTDSNFRSPN